MSTLPNTFANFEAAPPARPLHAGASRWPRWALCLGLFACFFVATQDLNSPIAWRGANEGQSAEFVARVAEGRASRQIGFLTLAAISTIALLLPDRRSIERRLDWLVIYPLVAVVGWSVASLLWSHDPALTVKRLVVYLALCLAVLAVVKHFTIRDLVAAVLFYGVASYAAGAYAELSSGLGLAAGPDGFRLSGSMHPNHLGLTSGLLALAALHRLTTSRDAAQRALLAALIALAFVVLVLTKSRTALAASVLAFGVMAGLRTRPAVAVGTLLLGVGALGLGFFLVEAGLLGPVWEALLMGRETSSVRTLTGRTDIWAYSLNVLLADPGRLVMGFGHDSFWNDVNTEGVTRAVGYTISEAHNAYLERLLNIGVVGLFLVLAATFAAAWRWLASGRTRRGRWRADAAFCLAVIVMALVHGVAESTFAHSQFVTLVMFCCIALAAAGPVDVPPDAVEGDE